MKLKLLPKSKRAFLARTWLIAFVTGVAIMALCYLMAQGLATEYDNLDVIDENFQNTYDKYSTLQGSFDEMLDEVSSEEGLSLRGTFDVIWGGTTTIIQLIFSSLLLPGAMLRQFSIDVGAPTAVANIIFTLPLVIITVVIVLVVVSFIGRGRL